MRRETFLTIFRLRHGSKDTGFGIASTASPASALEYAMLKMEALVGAALAAALKASLMGIAQWLRIVLKRRL